MLDSLTLHNVQTRNEFPCMILAWTVNNLILCVAPTFASEWNKEVPDLTSLDWKDTQLNEVRLPKQMNEARKQTHEQTDKPQTTITEVVNITNQGSKETDKRIKIHTPWKNN